MWLMLQQDEPEDMIIGSGELHTVRDFCREAFSVVDLDYHDYVIEDEQYFRPVEAFPLLADPEYAYLKLGWQPEVDFEALVRMMVEADLKDLQKKLQG
jgi:GDPmannose 4,6-dehydratase